MLETTTVSVVIPVYNSLATVGLAIDSCLRQTALPDEVIIIDDCSSDATGEVIRQKIAAVSGAFPAVRFILISTMENSGPAVARNLGCDIARGDFIAFLDADDRWHPEKIEQCLRVIQDRPDCWFLGHAFSVNTYEKLSNDPVIRTYNPVRVLLKNPTVTPAILFSKKITERFNPKMKYAEDHDFIFRCSLITPIFYLDQKLVALGRVPGSRGGLSEKKIRMRLGELSMYVTAAQRVKWLIPWFPVLVFYSISKHIFRLLRNGIEKLLKQQEVISSLK